jgi:hypothetical protein
MALKGSELAEAIEAAFKTEWERTKVIPFPSAGAEDRMLLFAAVAHGLFNYLEDNQNEFIASITLRRDSQDTRYEVSNLDLDITKGS